MIILVPGDKHATSIPDFQNGMEENDGLES